MKACVTKIFTSVKHPLTVIHIFNMDISEYQIKTCILKSFVDNNELFLLLRKFDSRHFGKPCQLICKRNV